jgi:hypothetical protein
VSELVLGPDGPRWSRDVIGESVAHQQSPVQPIRLVRDAMGHVRLEDPARDPEDDGRIIHEYERADDYVTCCLTAARLNLGFANPLFVGKAQGTIECLDPVNPARGRLLSQRLLLGHLGPVTDLGESPWEPFLLSTSLDGTVRFWEFRSEFAQGWPDLDVSLDGIVLEARDQDLRKNGVQPGDRWRSMKNVLFSALLDDCLAGRWRFRQGDRVRCVFEHTDGGVVTCEITLGPSNAAYQGPFLNIMVIPPEGPQAQPDWVAWLPNGTYAASERGEAFVFRATKEEAFSPPTLEPAGSPPARQRYYSLGNVKQAAARILNLSAVAQP